MTTNTVVVVHGKSEIALMRRVQNILRMPMVIVSRDNGEETITISQLPEFLSTGAFSSENSLHKAYPQLEYTPRAKMKMERLRIFTVMDVDMDRRSLGSYQTRDMFRDSPFHDRIIPIHNDPNMDEVMSEIGFGVVQNKKIRSYAKMMDDVTDPMDLLRRLEGCDNTNMDLLIRHCLSSRPPYQNQIKPV